MKCTHTEGGPSYQFNSSKSSNSQGVDDVEVHQLQVGEEGILRLVSAFFEVEKGKLLRGLDGVCYRECWSRNWGRNAVYSLPLLPLLYRDRK